jgi:hypothetical protein
MYVGHASSEKVKSSDIRKRGEVNLGQKEARLEKEKASELTRISEKSRKSQKSKMEDV